MEPSRRFRYFAAMEPSIVLTVPQFPGYGTVKYCTKPMYTSRLLLMVPPIESDLGYRFRRRTLTLTRNLTLTLILELTLTLTLFLAVTGTKFLKENKNDKK